MGSWFFLSSVLVSKETVVLRQYGSENELMFGLFGKRMFEWIRYLWLALVSLYSA